MDITKINGLLDEANIDFDDALDTLSDLGITKKDMLGALRDKSGKTADVVFTTIMNSNPYTAVIHQIGTFLQGVFGGQPKPFQNPFIQFDYDSIKTMVGNDGKPIDKYLLPKIGGSLDWLLMAGDSPLGTQMAQHSGLGDSGQFFAQVMIAMGSKVIKKKKLNVTPFQATEMFKAVEAGAKIFYLEDELLNLDPLGLDPKGQTGGQSNNRGGNSAFDLKSTGAARNYVDQRNNRNPETSGGGSGIIIALIALFLIFKS